MLVVRNVFRCKPGGAKHLVKKFKDGFAAAPGAFGGTPRVLTDMVAGFWTVVVELQFESLEAMERGLAERGKDEAVGKAMEGYMDFVESGHREVLKVE